MRGAQLDAAGVASGRLGIARRVIAVLRLGVFSYWTNTYHAGGSLATLGGALMLGALPRLMKTAKLSLRMLMGIGIAILVLTRPYEGILLCLPLGLCWAAGLEGREPAARCAPCVAH